jgi:hypothetical protein
MVITRVFHYREEWGALWGFGSTRVFFPAEKIYTFKKAKGDWK